MVLLIDFCSFRAKQNRIPSPLIQTLHGVNVGAKIFQLRTTLAVKMGKIMPYFYVLRCAQGGGRTQNLVSEILLIPCYGLLFKILGFLNCFVDVIKFYEAAVKELSAESCPGACIKILGTESDLDHIN